MCVYMCVFSCRSAAFGRRSDRGSVRRRAVSEVAAVRREDEEDDDYKMFSTIHLWASGIGAAYTTNDASVMARAFVDPSSGYMW